MTDALAAADVQRAKAAPLEERLFLVSPLGIAGTAALVFAVIGASYVLVARLSGYPLAGASGAVHLAAIMPGFATALLVATILGMQRYATVRQAAEAPAFAQIISDGDEAAAERPTRLLLASVVGAVVVGLPVTALTVPTAQWHVHPAVYVWRAAFCMLLCILAARGFMNAARNGANLRRRIDRGLTVELLHVDRLAVIGRQSARNALVWFTAVAVLCLYFVGDAGNNLAMPIVVLACAGVGLWIFLRPMLRVRHRISVAKEAELERLRAEIGRAVAQERGDAHAAARLPGLVAYEARIQAVREWPFDNSTLMRVGAYVLIPTIPWFGQAVVNDLLERLAH